MSRTLSLIGKKLGMTQVFNSDGSATAVTVIHVGGNQVLNVFKDAGKTKLNAYRVGYGDQLARRLKKPVLGQFAKLGCPPKRRIRQFNVPGVGDVPETGTVLGPEVFPVGSFVDVIGTTIGHGFQGVVKRYGFAGQPDSHGSMMHRRPGSIGCRLTPGLVWKNQKMPGHMGNKRRTVQSLRVIQSRPDDGVLVIAGCVPGVRGSFVVVRPAVKDPAARIAKTLENMKRNKGADKKDAKKK